MNPEVYQKVVRGIIRGIQVNGEEVFHISQQTNRGFCPVITGFLKRSGIEEKTDDGYMLAYRAPYASIVEHGAPAHEETVEAHTRTIRRGRGGKRLKTARVQQVPRHTRSVRERKGQFFILRARKEARKVLTNHLKREIQGSLRS